MADFGNQLEGATEGLDRFLNALDNAAVKLGSNAALETRIAREEYKRLDQEKRFKKTLNKLESDHAKQVKTMQPVYKKLWTGIKDEVKQRSLLTKGMKEMSKSMTEFAKKALGGIGKGIAAIGKAGALGGMVASVKLITDGLLAGDAAMAKISGRVSMTRKELVGVGAAAKGAQANMALMGVSLEETTATAGNLVEAFGQTKYVTDQTIESALRLEKAYGLSSEAAANLTEHLVRSGSSMREFTDMVTGKANVAMVSAGLVMRDLASRTQQMAMHGERGVEAMTQMAVRAAKAGTSMKGFDGMADAFSSVETTVENLGELGAAFPDLVAKMGNPEEIYWNMFEGGKAAADQQQKITDALAEQFDWDAKRGLVDKAGRKVAEGRIKQLAQGIGMESEFMIRQIRSTDELNEMDADERKAWLKTQKKKDEALERENAVIKNSQTMLQKISNIWKGLYTTLVGQLDEIFWTGETGAAEFGSSIDNIGVKLKEALSLDTFAKDVKEGGWAEAIGDRLKPIMKSVAIALQDKLKEVFPNFAKEIEAGGGGVGGFVTAFKGRIVEGLRAGLAEALGKSPEEIDELAKTATTTLGVMGAVGGVVKVMSALKGTFLNPMWVQIKGMGGFGGKAGKAAAKVAAPRGAAGTAYDTARGRGAGRVAAAGSALKQAGQGSVVKGAGALAAQQAVTSSKNAAKLAGTATKAIGKGILKKIPLLGAAAGIYFAYDRIANGGDWLGGMLELGSGLASIIPGAGTAVSVGIDTALMARDVKRAGDAQGAEPTALEQAVATSALGRIGGGLSLVGEEGRGEVVVSRSALRSGIGVGGRAASALAGIGVPGFREGYARRDFSGVHGRQGLMGAQGSQSFRSARADAFQAEQAKQQAAMMEYWRQHYESKMEDMVDEKVKKPKEPPWLAKFFLKHNVAIGKELNKRAGPTMTAAIMNGMTKWSKGGSLKEAMEVGAKAGILAGINDPDSKLNAMLERTGRLGDVLKAGMATWAGGGSGEDIKRAVVGTGARTLASMIRDRRGKKKTETKSTKPIDAKGLGDDTLLAAKGQYVNSPTLMMVGEEGRGEVVVPTERIRKGLPINKGVANELASIGVPGFAEGGEPFKAGDSFGKQGGWGESMATGLEGFASVYEQTGDWKQAASAGVGGGIGMAAGMGLTALGVPPPLSTMIGGVVGNIATKGINKIFKITGGYGKGRRRALKKIEDHIKTGGRFDFGAPSGLSKDIGQAVGGYEKTPTEANFNKTVEKLGTSRLVASMGVPAPALIALFQGQVGGNQGIKMYDDINKSLYGNTPDRYRKALSIPALAEGGIVNRPTTALIGERGPEAVVPLRDSEMVNELKKQNKLMAEMIKTQKETAQTEIRLDGRVVSEVVGDNFYDIGNGM